MDHAELANGEDTQLKKKTDGIYRSDRVDQTAELQKDMHKSILVHSAYRGNIFDFLDLFKIVFSRRGYSSF